MTPPVTRPTRVGKLRAQRPTLILVRNNWAVPGTKKVNKNNRRTKRKESGNREAPMGKGGAFLYKLARTVRFKRKLPLSPFWEKGRGMSRRRIGSSSSGIPLNGAMVQLAGGAVKKKVWGKWRPCIGA